MSDGLPPSTRQMPTIRRAQSLRSARMTRSARLLFVTTPTKEAPGDFRKDLMRPAEI